MKIIKGNAYLQDCEPWKIIATDKERAGTILYLAVCVTKLLTVLR